MSEPEPALVAGPLPAAGAGQHGAQATAAPAATVGLWVAEQSKDLARLGKPMGPLRAQLEGGRRARRTVLEEAGGRKEQALQQERAKRGSGR